MGEKYHLATKVVPPRLPRIGKYGTIDWREDCARCHNCVKKACIYDKYREENAFIRNLDEVNSLFYECMGCLSCMQDCTKGLLTTAINPEFKQLGNAYWTPDIVQNTWYEAETAGVPVSGSGYRGPFSGPGFDAMWTDMSEIVRPTRDGIHGREYISTSVDIGRKPFYLNAEIDNISSQMPPLITLPFPVIFDLIPKKFSFPELEGFIIQAARNTGLMTLIDSCKWPNLQEKHDQDLNHIILYLNPQGPKLADEIITRSQAVEILWTPDLKNQIESLKAINPQIIIMVRINLDQQGIQQALTLYDQDLEVVHLVADSNGNEMKTDNPRFIKDMIRSIHTSYRDKGVRDELTIIAGGGIAMAEHLAKAIICGADLVSLDFPLLLALECRLCDQGCTPRSICPAKLNTITSDYAVGRMTNLMASWHWQLVEVMGAMGMREARRLRGEVGRAMFYDELERDIFGTIFKPEK